MKLKQWLNTYGAISVIIILTVIIAGCAASTNLWGDPESGLILSYRMEKDKPYSYQMVTKTDQELEMMGNKVQTGTDATYSYTIVNKGGTDSNLNLDFTLNDMKMEVKSPMGNMNPNLESVVGKKFEMVLSKLGKELSFTNLDNLKYEIMAGQERGVSSDFKLLFPDLSEKALKVGDKWTSYDTLDADEGGVKLHMELEINNTYEGVETINGVECAKITADTKGTMSGSGNQGGMSFTMSGTSTGQDNWYFDFKSGILTSMHSTADTDAEIKGSNMTIPMKMKMTIDNTLK